MPPKHVLLDFDLESHVFFLCHLGLNSIGWTRVLHICITSKFGTAYQVFLLLKGE
jgi:hypothetical protein